MNIKEMNPPFDIGMARVIEEKVLSRRMQLKKQVIYLQIK